MNRINVMDQVHLVGEEEDDYAGFNDYNAALDTEVRLCRTEEQVLFYFEVRFILLFVNCAVSVFS